MQQALQAGYKAVKLKAGNNYTNLSDYLPSPENGGLFPADIAAEFARFNKEWNALYNNDNVNKFVRAMIEVSNVIKATQTVINPRHFFVNLSDYVTALMAGATNPRDWKKGFYIALQYASADFKADWSKNNLDAVWDQMIRTLGVDEVVPRKLTPEKQKALMEKGRTFMINGKQVFLSNDELMRRLEAQGILIKGIHQADMGMFYEKQQATMATARGHIRESAQKKAAQIKIAWESAISKPADVVSYFGNGARVSHALSISGDKNWKSLDEMFQAMGERVAMYHPTITSLAVGERRGPRMIFAYYTWLRVAHNAFIDIAMNHTAMITLYPKAAYNAREQQGIEQQSIGNPWADKALYPEYIDYSIHGPITKDDEGLWRAKPTILPMDILDTWKFAYNPALSPRSNLDINIEKGSQFFGSQLNYPIKTGLETLFKTDIATGAPIQTYNQEQVTDRLLSNIGWTQAAKGLGLYTPYGKELTPEQRQQALFNWMFGLKVQRLGTESDVRNATLDIKKVNKYLEAENPK